MARDQGSPILESMPLIIPIKILDENDNDPLFRKSKYEQNITENLSSGVFVMDLKADDADIGENGRVSYSILSGGKGYFSVDNKTGTPLIQLSGLVQLSG